MDRDVRDHLLMWGRQGHIVEVPVGWEFTASSLENTIFPWSVVPSPLLSQCGHMVALNDEMWQKGL